MALNESMLNNLTTEEQVHYGVLPEPIIPLLDQINLLQDCVAEAHVIAGDLLKELELMAHESTRQYAIRSLRVQLPRFKRELEELSDRIQEQMGGRS